MIMEYHQINLTGQEIDERLQNVGTPADNPDANGTLFARLNKNVDDVDALNDSVGHIQDAQTATNKTVTQHTSDISTLQTTVSKNKTAQDAIAQKVAQNATAIVENRNKINDHESRQSNIEEVVSGERNLYFTLDSLRLRTIGSFKTNNIDIDNVKVKLYRWSGQRYSEFKMFTQVGENEPQQAIDYQITLKQESVNSGDERKPYITYSDDNTEHTLFSAIKNAFGRRISTRKTKKRRWRIQAFLNDKPITAPFDFKMSIDLNDYVILTKEGMMRSVPASSQVKYDGYYDVNKWINCKVGEELDLNYCFFNEDLGLIRRKFPNPGDVMVENASSHTLPRGVIISVFQDTPGSYCILWSNGESIYEIGIDLDTNEYGGYNCYFPAKKLCDDIYNYVSKMNSGTLRDLYISAGAKYNEATGFYELNGLNDITEEEMRVIYDQTWGWWLKFPYFQGFGSSKPRTNIPCPDYKAIYYAPVCDMSSSFSVSGNDNNLEVVNFRPSYCPDSEFDKIKVSNMAWMFQGGKKPLTIIGTFDAKYAPSSTNNYLSIGGNVKTINIKNLSKNIKFYQSKVLSKESVLFMIQNSFGSDAFTIGLQKEVYDVMKDDADIIAALTEKTNITLVQNS